MIKRFYVHDEQRWTAFAEKLHMQSGKVSARTVRHALLLPPVDDTEGIADATAVDAVYRGGVLAQSGECLPGHLRTDDERKPGNLSCVGSYEIDCEKVERKDERVLFAGVLYRHFGHMLADGLARMWYLAGSEGTPSPVDLDDFDRIVFFECPFRFSTDFDPFALLDLLGLPRDKVEIIRRPTEYSEVVVPDEAFHAFGEFHREFIHTFDAMKRKIAPGTARKVYLSRRAYQNAERDNPEATSFIYNEQFYERFYERRGYAIVYPDRLTVEEQIAVVAGATDIVATVGTLTHLLLFASPDAHVTILNRADLIGVQMRIDMVRGIEPVYIEATSNPLPVTHARGPFLMMPNRHFRAYLNDCDIAYDPGEFDMQDELPLLLFEFLKEWARIYRTKGCSRHIANSTMFDVIRLMNEAVNDNPGCTEDYREADKLRTANKRLRARTAEQKREIVELKTSMERMRSSTFWKITKPLRAAKRLLTRHSK